MANIISIPIMVFLLMLQTGIISHIPLLNGTADIMLLVLVAWSLQEKVTNAWFWALVAGGLVCLVSATPYFAPLFDSHWIGSIIAEKDLADACTCNVHGYICWIIRVPGDTLLGIGR
jgi:hypothetical protein